jgi:hypothetical protein
MTEEQVEYAVKVRDEDLSPEELKKRKAAEEYDAYRKSFDNSWEKNYESGYDGNIKRRVPSEKTNWDKLWIDYLDWDFHMITNGTHIPYQVIRIDGYYHTVDNCYYCYDLKYEHNYNEYKNNLIPFDDQWRREGLGIWSFDIMPRVSYYVKWDEYRTRSGYIGHLYRAGVLYADFSGGSELDVLSQIMTHRNMLESHALDILSRGWEKKCVGKRIDIRDERFVIQKVSIYGRPLIHIKNIDNGSIVSIELDNPNVQWYPRED